MSSSFSEEDIAKMYLYLSMKIRDTANFIVLMDSTNSMCLLVERIGGLKCQFHIYSIPESRGSYILTFAKECAEWIFSNTIYTSFLSFVSSRHAALFIRKIGLSSVGDIEDAGGPGNTEVLYSGTIGSISKKLNIKLGGI